MGLRLKWLAFALVLAPCGHAKIRYEPSRDLKNLVYYPHVDVFEILARAEATVRDQTTPQDGKSVARSVNQITANMIYGMAPRWRIGVAETLLWDQNAETLDSAATSTDNSSHGFSNPSLTIAWRFWQQSNEALAADLSLTYAPSLGAAVLPNGAIGSSGNNLPGYAAWTLGTTIFWRRSPNEILLTAGASCFGSGDYEASTPATSYQTSARCFATAGASDRIHFSSQIFAQLSVTVTAASATDLSLGDGTVKHQKDPLGVSPELEIGFQPDPRVVWQIGAAYRRATINTQSAQATTTSHNETITAAFRLLHQF